MALEHLQVYARGNSSPLTEYFVWPRKDAWEELKLALEARPWISDKDKILLLNRLAVGGTASSACAAVRCAAVLLCKVSAAAGSVCAVVVLQLLLHEEGIIIRVCAAEVVSGGRLQAAALLRHGTIVYYNFSRMTPSRAICANNSKRQQLASVRRAPWTLLPCLLS